MQCSNCQQALRWDHQCHLHVCEACQTQWQPIGYCPDCQAQLEIIRACGSTSYFCSACASLKSSQRIVLQWVAQQK